MDYSMISELSSFQIVEACIAQWLVELVYDWRMDLLYIL